MADLLTTQSLARWTQSDDEEVAADPFAVDLIDKVSQLICWIGGHPDWTLDQGPDQAPIDVQMVALQVIKRSYENPGRVIQEGSIGPLGGDRVDDVQALFAELTEAERATVAKYNPAGDPDGTDGAGFVFTVSTDDSARRPLVGFGYVGDNQQVNLASSPDPREWMIPLFNPGDPGDPALYDDEA